MACRTQAQMACTQTSCTMPTMFLERRLCYKAPTPLPGSSSRTAAWWFSSIRFCALTLVALCADVLTLAAALSWLEIMTSYVTDCPGFHALMWEVHILPNCKLQNHQSIDTRLVTLVHLFHERKLELHSTHSRS